MANLSSFSMIDSKVNKYRIDFNLESAGTAFAWVALEALLNLNAEEIEEALTDGYMDGGIDAVHVDNKDIHVFSFKYTNTFENTRSNFPENDLDKILVTMDRVYNKSIIKEDVNAALWDKIRDIWSLFESGPPNFHYYICSNKQKPAEHAIRKFESHLNKYSFLKYYYIDQEEIANELLEKKHKKVDGQVTFIEKQYFERVDGFLRGVVATITATDLVGLVKDPDDETQINESAFDDNARIYQGLKTNEVNQSIYETALSDENYEFWYLNNGITVICEECAYMPNTRSPKVNLKNLQIVNGGQTTHTLFAAYQQDPEKVDNVLVLVRICQTKDNRISDKISETTNRQTPVVSRDLRANDKIQKKIEDEFKNLGYFYERKKNQYANELKSKRLDNELLGQIYLAFYLNMPSEVKNRRKIVFDSKYDDIFNESTTANKLLLPYRVYLPIEERKKDIQKKKRSKTPIDEREAFVPWATFHVLYAVKLLAEKNHLNLDNEENIHDAINEAIGYLEGVVKSEMSKLGNSYTHDKFFKGSSANKIIREAIMETKFSR